MSIIYDVTEDTTDVEFMYVHVCTKTFLPSEKLCKLSARYKDNIFLLVNHDFIHKYDTLNKRLKKEISNTAYKHIRIMFNTLYYKCSTVIRKNNTILEA